ncbi:hypothetical protein IQ64_37890 [Streptomyces stelliscabiei]|uniref:Putative secreted protein n=1 Tax=Streptomyces stelliscabiei TaxID=146820 RepID=A0A8I0P0V2_9ACTN|nr:hypothetical protein IQ61_05680 [Streptomyces scabiei]KND38800.1 hypothetical protein IQ64_37890 [Streptomyces stelliscabiei]MBE1594194.1 putative secreted protein [Streptomyces stelliscabiei]
MAEPLCRALSQDGQAVSLPACTSQPRQKSLLMAVLLSTEACGVVMGAWPGVRVRGAVLGPLALVNR